MHILLCGAHCPTWGPNALAAGSSLNLLLLELEPHARHTAGVAHVIVVDEAPERAPEPVHGLLYLRAAHHVRPRGELCLERRKELAVDHLEQRDVEEDRVELVVREQRLCAEQRRSEAPTPEESKVGRDQSRRPT